MDSLIICLTFRGVACIWKHPKSKFWYARFRDERGIVVNRSTKSAGRTDAAEIARTLEHAAREARAGLLTQERARVLVSQILERTTDHTESIRATSVRLFVQQYLESTEAEVTAATQERYRGILRFFLKHLGGRADRTINALLPKDVEAYVAGRLKEVSVSTVAFDLRVLSALFNRARRLGQVDRNPCLGVRLPKAPKHQRSVFTEGELRAVLTEATGDWKTAVLAGIHLGARLRDVTNLRWADLDLVAGTATFIVSKTKKRISVPLALELREHLEAIAGDQMNGYVMPSLAGRTTNGAAGLSSEFGALLRRAGVDQRYEAGKARRQSKLSYHSLRHTAISRMASAGISPELRMRLVGHSSARVHEGYTHLSTDQLAGAVNSVPRVG